jgi:hypothetical protein
MDIFIKQTAPNTIILKNGRGNINKLRGCMKCPLRSPDFMPKDFLLVGVWEGNVSVPPKPAIP